jgi:GT2 family glycosyltransferase
MSKVLIGVPTPNYSRNDSFYDYFLQLDKPEGTIQTFARGQSPARNRNLIIQQAITNNCTHILFLDDDTAPPKDMLTKLLEHDKDIVTGLYLMRSFPHKPIIFDFADKNGRCLTHYLDKAPETGLVPIVAAGLGAVLIKIEVFKAMPGPFWITLGELESDHWCDDISFFRRAIALGFKAYCDLSIRVGHFCQATVTPEFLNNQWNTILNTNGTRNVVIPQLPPSEDEVKLRESLTEKV